MSETGPEKLQRVRQMASDTGGTWDLSPNDQLALRHVLELLDEMAKDLAEKSESVKVSPEDVMAAYHCFFSKK